MQKKIEMNFSHGIASHHMLSQSFSLGTSNCNKSRIASHLCAPCSEVVFSWILLRSSCQVEAIKQCQMYVCATYGSALTWLPGRRLGRPSSQVDHYICVYILISVDINSESPSNRAVLCWPPNYWRFKKTMDRRGMLAYIQYVCINACKRKQISICVV